MTTDKLTSLFKRFYILIFAFVFSLYTGLAFLAPVLMHHGWVLPAMLLYKFFGFFCHQLPYRSFFLFGRQVFYPLASANMDRGILTFEEATQNTEMNFFDLKSFVGNPQMGYKVALCQRDIAIYLAIVLFCFIFLISNYRIPRLHWILWVFIGLFPIGLDGLTQLFSTIIPAIFPARESTPFLRVITGAMFGFNTAWFLFPYLDKKLKEDET